MAIQQVWEDIFSTRVWGNYPNEALIRFVARNFYAAPARSEIRFLEVGCGHGTNLWFLCREGFTAHGVDGSPSALKQARRRLESEFPGRAVELSLGDVVDLPYADGLFDGVIDNQCISCNDTRSARRIYAEMARVLRPGGKLFSRTFARGCSGKATPAPDDADFLQFSTGPLTGRGWIRMTEADDIPGLLGKALRIDGVEKYTNTIDNGRERIAEWAIEATRI